MIDVFLKKLRSRDVVSEAEEARLRAIMVREHRADKGETVVQMNQPMSESLLLVEGLACRYKDMRDGGRQILELNIAGDFVDLHAFLLKTLDHNIGALTPCSFIWVRHDDLTQLTEDMPHLTRLLWLQTVLDAAIHREWVMSLGRRPARARLAQLFIELHERLAIVGLARDGIYALPLTQMELAEISGLTTVHVNRTLKVLREAGLVTIRGGKVRIENLAGLRDAAEFDATYLNLVNRPR